MKNTINYLGYFGLVVLPVVFAILSISAYWIIELIRTHTQIG